MLARAFRESALPIYSYREWERAIADAKTILAGIATIVDETKTILEDALPLAKKQRQWSKRQKH
jgi:hypothetical protein